VIPNVILDRATFDQVQDLLKENNVRRGTKFSESGALLKGKLFDDKDNRMGPTFSSKNGVRYRFYISTACAVGNTKRAQWPEFRPWKSKAWLRRQFGKN
jgi:hypothetical protein